MADLGLVALDADVASVMPGSVNSCESELLLVLVLALVLSSSELDFRLTDSGLSTFCETTSASGAVVRCSERRSSPIDVCDRTRTTDSFASPFSSKTQLALIGDELLESNRL